MVLWCKKLCKLLHRVVEHIVNLLVGYLVGCHQLVQAPTVLNLRMETHYDETDRVVATLYALPDKKLVQRGKADTTAGGDQHGVYSRLLRC